MGSSGDRPNTIQSNGTGSQSGSYGADIYLASASYPDVNYNNIIDYDAGPVGYMIYKDEWSCTGSLDATHNYWGTSSPSGSFFYRGVGYAIDYSSPSSSMLSSVQYYNLALNAWEDADYETAAGYFEECLYDTGRTGYNSIRYIVGCYANMEDADLEDVADELFEVCDNHESDLVAWEAWRGAACCYIEMGDYDSALGEYESMQDAAETYADSIQAVVDWMSVAELADLDGIDADGRSLVGRMKELLASIANDYNEFNATIPEKFALMSAYPNPFNGMTTLIYDLPLQGMVKITVHDLTGRQVALLVNDNLSAGRYSSTWDASNFGSGTYLIRMQAGAQTQVRKVLLLK